jgi:hypothetical protein
MTWQSGRQEIRIALRDGDLQQVTGKIVARKPRPLGRGERISDVSVRVATVVATTESPGEILRSRHRPASGKVIGEAAETQTPAAPARDRADRRERKSPRLTAVL